MCAQSVQFLSAKLFIVQIPLPPINQVVSDRISRRMTLVILCGVALIVFAVMRNIAGINQESAPATLLTVLFVGAMGGC
jgi:hypothetical protein